MRKAPASGGASLSPLEAPPLSPRQPADPLLLVSLAGSVGGKKLDIISGWVLRSSWSSGRTPQHTTLFSAACTNVHVHVFAKRVEFAAAPLCAWPDQRIYDSIRTF